MKNAALSTSTNFAKSIQTVLLIVAAVPLIICSSPAQTNQTSAIWGAPVDGLQISLSLGPSTVLPSHIPALKLDLRNVGTKDLKVSLGGGCGPWPTGYTDNVDLILVDSSGIPKRLMLRQFSFCAGVLVVNQVLLSPGASYSTPIMLDFYGTSPRTLPTDNKGFERGWERGGRCTLEAELSSSRFGKPSLPAWQGTVTSNLLEVHFPLP
jgi:hypothetical protein